jgi:hypothetical protein
METQEDACHFLPSCSAHVPFEWRTGGDLRIMGSASGISPEGAVAGSDLISLLAILAISGIKLFLDGFSTSSTTLKLDGNGNRLWDAPFDGSNPGAARIASQRPPSPPECEREANRWTAARSRNRGSPKSA